VSAAAVEREIRREIGQLADDAKTRLAASRVHGDRRIFDFHKGELAAFQFALEIGLPNGRP